MSKCHIVGNHMSWLNYYLFITVKEDPYLTPGYLSTISRTEGDGGMISTLSEKDENRERKENKYY